MNGYHRVKTFPINIYKPVDLPPGWKPFAMYGNTIVARKWERIEEKGTPAFDEHTQPCSCAYCRFLQEVGPPREQGVR